MVQDSCADIERDSKWNTNSVEVPINYNVPFYYGKILGLDC